MTLRRFLVGVFAGYALLVLALGGEYFGPGMATVSYAMAGTSAVISLMFLVNRCFALNFMIATYVASKYFVAPWVERLYPFLDQTQETYLRSLLEYYDAHSASRAFLFLFLCLVGWLLGLVVAPRLAYSGNGTAPRVFRALDGHIFHRGPSFWVVLIAFSTLTIRSSLASGWGSASGASEEGLLFFGLLNPSFIADACLVAFLYSLANGQGRKHYWLMFPILPSIVLSVVMGSRSALYAPILMVAFYVVSLRGGQLRIRLRLVVLVLVGICGAFAAGGVADTVRPLWRTNAGITEVSDRLKAEVIGGGLWSQSAYRLAVLIARSADLLGPFYIVNDRQVYDPWPYVNPVQVLMRTVNGMVPGDVFPGMLTINQLFNWIYMGEIVTYNSETWSIFGTAYLYFGYYGAPLAFLALAFLSCVAYKPLISTVRNSPSFAVFAIFLASDLIVGGTLERAIVVDVWTVVLGSIIFTQLVSVPSYLLGGIGPRQRAVLRGQAKVPGRVGVE